jgi:hypothetical protein
LGYYTASTGYNYQRFGVLSCSGSSSAKRKEFLGLLDLEIEVLPSFKMNLPVDRLNDLNLQQHRCENLKSCMCYFDVSSKYNESGAIYKIIVNEK